MRHASYTSALYAQDLTRSVQGLLKAFATCSRNANNKHKGTTSTGIDPPGDSDSGQGKRQKSSGAMLHGSIRDTCTFRNQSSSEAIVSTTVALSCIWVPFTLSQAIRRVWRRSTRGEESVFMPASSETKPTASRDPPACTKIVVHAISTSRARKCGHATN
jgi:hypothetical protein